mgnify:CR=1 FL=1
MNTASEFRRIGLALLLIGLAGCGDDANAGTSNGEGSSESSSGSSTDEIGSEESASGSSTESTTESTESTSESTTDTTESTSESTTESTTDTTTESTTDTTTESTTDTTESTGVEGCAGVCGTPECGQCPDFDTVQGPGFAIESTETPVGDYALFLEVPFSPALLHEDCGWKVSFEPDNWDEQMLDPELPVSDVDWCDAEAYCAWSGRHLCGAIGGGPAVFDPPEALTNEWYMACSNADTVLYPYGNMYMAMACNGLDAGVGAPVHVGSLAGCVGGLPGLFDMSGNVREWVDACASDPNTPDDLQLCQRRSGAYSSAANTLDCDSSSERPRGERSGSTGFRCCG